MTFLSLFAGIGGLDLGLERAGMRCIAQVEINPFCRRVLAKHWPNVPRFSDVRNFHREDLAYTYYPDLICGGFPCQDISKSNPSGRGLEGERSGLWSEMFRVICEFRPRYVLVENVSALLKRGVGKLLGDLASIGFDAEWECLPARAFGLPHHRERFFLVAYPMRQRLEGEGQAEIFTTHPPVVQVRRIGLSESSTLRRRNGAADYVDRITALGNAVVPAAAEWIGQQILQFDQQQPSAAGVCA